VVRSSVTSQVATEVRGAATCARGWARPSEEAQVHRPQPNENGDKTLQTKPHNNRTAAHSKLKPTQRSTPLLSPTSIKQRKGHKVFHDLDPTFAPAA
jgi:hypothetical protein